MSAISQHKSGHKTNVSLQLVEGATGVTPPEGVIEVLRTLLLNVVDNPINALANANYIGILAWALVLGLALKNAPASTKVMITNFSDALSQVVRWVINLAPLGIMGLVFDAVSTNGLESFREYGQLLLVLVGCMAFMALVVNPLITFIYKGKVIAFEAKKIAA